ncbi:MAG: DUF5343 domain-containing protein [Chloroflexi bacterium]|nr:DUF5343 domain-containing protein [Chloroflexota bacterium]
MAMIETDLGKRLAPPYGPTRGMLQALELLRRTTPGRVDIDFLRANGVAPGNEYKVVGALRFLGLIDDAGGPTERSRLLKTRGVTHTEALQEIVRAAYAGVFQHLQGQGLTRDGIYNYFVTRGGLGTEMSNKATRFLVKLCRIAEIKLAGNEERPRVPRKGPRVPPKTVRRSALSTAAMDNNIKMDSSLPLVIALTPEIAGMDLDQLTDLLRKVRTAWDRAGTPQG